MFRVLSAPIIRSTIKIADAFIGTVYVSVWFKSVERCPRSGVYFTMSWPNGEFIYLLVEVNPNYPTLLRSNMPSGVSKLPRQTRTA
jgi:hypothetical protein